MIYDFRDVSTLFYQQFLKMFVVIGNGKISLKKGKTYPHV